MFVSMDVFVFIYMCVRIKFNNEESDIILKIKIISIDIKQLEPGIQCYSCGRPWQDEMGSESISITSLSGQCGFLCGRTLELTCKTIIKFQEKKK